jgi:hypothetical protein
MFSSISSGATGGEEKTKTEKEKPTSKKVLKQNIAKNQEEELKAIRSGDYTASAE